MEIKALSLSGDKPDLRQLLKERRTVRIWNPASLEEFNASARRIDAFRTTEQINAELRRGRFGVSRSGL